jgi:cytochrome P450
MIIFFVTTKQQISTYVNGRDERNFKNASEFRPERFMKDSGTGSGGGDKEETIQNYVYFPFGLGSRNCIGQNFAQV